MERLVEALDERGIEAEVFSLVSADGQRRAGRTRWSQRRLRFRSIVWFPLLAARRARRHAGSGAALVATTNPFCLPGMLVAARWFHRTPVISLVYDMWPDAAVITSSIQGDHPVVRLAERFNRWWFHRSDAVVFIGHEMRKNLERRYGQHRCGVTIETGAMPTEFDSLPAQPSTEWHEIDEFFGTRLAMSYVGNMGLVHDVDTLTAGGSRLDPDAIRLLVAGWGPGVAHLENAWPPQDQRQATMVRAGLNDDDWRRTLKRTDVAVATLLPAAASTSLPSKAFSAMAAGCAVLAIAPDNSDLATVVRRFDAGTVIPPGDVDGFDLAIQSYATNPELLLAHQSGARKAADRFDIRRLVDDWIDLFSSIDDCR